MTELNHSDIQSLAKAVGLQINSTDLDDVSFSINALLSSMDGIDIKGTNTIHPLPIILEEFKSNE
jgi:hypothetical protein